MKKILLLTISLFMTYTLTFGQTNGTGTSCNDAIQLDHTQPQSCTNNTSSSEIWYTFTAHTTTMQFTTSYFTSNTSIVLYKDQCSSSPIQTIDNDYFTLNNLEVSHDYYLQITGLDNNQLTTCLSNYYTVPYTIDETCGNYPDCNQLSNGDFTNNTCNYMMSTLDGYLGDMFAFNHGDVMGWANFRGTADMLEHPFLGEYARLWCENESGKNSESIISCVELEANQMYVLTYKHNRQHDSQAEQLAIQDISIRMNIGNSTDLDGLRSSATPTPNYTANIIHQVDNVSNTSSSTESQVFIPTTDADRFFIYADTDIPTTEYQRYVIGDLAIIPIYYADVATCVNSITLEQTCETQINDITGLTFQWTSNVAGSITAGATTLTPTVIALDNPLLTLTLTQNGVNYTTEVQITYGTPEITADITHVACSLSQNGAIDITVTGGTEPYTFEWEDSEGFSSTDEDITGLSSGQYNVTVTDANGCTSLKKIDVLELGLNTEVVTTDTHGGCCGTANVTTLNGLAPFSYNWTSLNGYANNTSNSEITELCEGTYNLTVTDADGCTSINQANIHNIPCGLPVPEEIWLCGTASITLTANTTTPQWSTGETTQNITVTETGVYSYTTPTTNGCSSCPYYFVVRDNEQFRLEVEFSCEDNKEFRVIASSGFDTYQWTVEYLYDDGTPYTPSGTIPSSNTNTIDGRIADVNDYFDMGITTFYTVTAVLGNCSITQTVEIQHFNELSQDNYSIHDDNLYIINNSGNEILSAIPLSDLSNGAVRIHGDIKIIGNMDAINAHWVFKEHKGITVYNPITFRLMGTTLSNDYCDDTPWAGVVVLGDPNKPDYPTYQPRVRVLSQSKIKFAETALSSKNGGIIQVDNSILENNAVAVSYSTYDAVFQQSYSYINNSLLETNPDIDIVSNLDFNTFIISINYPNIIVRSSSLRNINFGLAYDERGTGIYTYQSSILFNYLSSLADYQPLIYNMTNGIIAEKTKSVTLMQAQFKDNYKGALLRKVGETSIKRTSFDDISLVATPNAFQLKLENCEIPEVTLNNFSHGVVGIAIQDGIGDYEIYKNNFTGFNNYNASLDGYPSAIVTTGANGNLENGVNAQGLQLRCNNFQDYDYAISLMTGHMKREQGFDQSNNTDASVNNIFTLPDALEGQFYVDELALETNVNPNDVKYKYYEYGTDAMINDTKLNEFTSLFNNGNPDRIEPIGVEQGLPFNYVDFCEDYPSPTSGGGGSLPPSMREVETKVEDLNTEESIKTQDLETKVDKGNTELMLSEIQMATPDNYTDLVVEMEETEAYISDKVALDFMQKDLDRPIAKTVALIANSPLPAKAKQKIDEMSLTENLKNLLKSYQNGLSNRELKELEISKIKKEKQNLLRQGFRTLLSDTTLNDSLKTLEINLYMDLLTEQNEWQYRKQAVSMMLSANRTEDALVQIAILRQDLHTLEDNYAEHSEQYLNLLSLEAVLKPMDKTARIVKIAENAAWLEALTQANYADGKTDASLLLEEAGLKTYDATILLPNAENRNRTAMAEPMQTSFNFSNLSDLIDIYPNPANEQLTVEFVMFNGQSVDNLGIYDLNGRLLISHRIKKSFGLVKINVSNLAHGTYIIAFGTSGVTKNSKKFVVKR